MPTQAFGSILHADGTGTRLPGVHNYHALTHKNARFLSTRRSSASSLLGCPPAGRREQQRYYSRARNPLPSHSRVRPLFPALKDRRGPQFGLIPLFVTPLSSPSPVVPPLVTTRLFCWIATPFRSLNTPASSPRWPVFELRANPAHNVSVIKEESDLPRLESWNHFVDRNPSGTHSWFHVDLASSFLSFFFFLGRSCFPEVKSERKLCEAGVPGATLLLWRSLSRDWGSRVFRERKVVVIRRVTFGGDTFVQMSVSSNLLQSFFSIFRVSG